MHARTHAAYQNSHCPSGNWNYCESNSAWKGGYDNGNMMSMDIYVGNS